MNVSFRNGYGESAQPCLQRGIVASRGIAAKNSPANQKCFLSKLPLWQRRWQNSSRETKNFTNLDTTTMWSVRAEWQLKLYCACLVRRTTSTSTRKLRRAGLNRRHVCVCYLVLFYWSMLQLGKFHLATFDVNSDDWQLTDQSGHWSPAARHRREQCP